jgi:FlaA1/EpsC-like NDP-sugar epimerase
MTLQRIDYIIQISVQKNFLSTEHNPFKCIKTNIKSDQAPISLAQENKGKKNIQTQA